MCYSLRHFACLLIAGLVLAGCQTTQTPTRIAPVPLNLGGTTLAELELLYHPYGPSLARQLAMPMPDYAAWTELRQERDLARWRDLGLARLVLVLDPRQDLTPGVAARTTALLAALAREPNAPKAILQFDCHDLSAEQWEAMLTWCRALVLTDEVAYERGGGGVPVIRLTRAGERAQAPVPGVRLESWQWESPAELRGLPVLAHAQVARLHGALRLPAALAGSATHAKDRWLLPRQDGKSLRLGWRASLALRPRILQLASWNDYREGSFIEPNSLDGDALLATWREEIATLGATLPKPPAAASSLAPLP